MNTQLLTKLRKHLSSITSEQFQEEWATIEAMGFEGMPVEEFIKTLHSAPTISLISSNNAIFCDMNGIFNSTPAGESSFAFAA